jgi:arylsulfatase
MYQSSIQERFLKKDIVIVFISIVVFAILFIFPGCSTDEKLERPNILLIVADDLGYSDIGCYGGEIETPNLDRLAENGVRFTQFYNTARCCPSRASLVTGLHPHQTGMGAMDGDRLGVHGYMGQINENCVTLAEVLKPAGYSTYCVGKWHLTHSLDGTDKSDWPLQRGFDRYFGTIYGAGSYFDPRMLYYDNEIATSSPDGFYYTDAISDTAVEFLHDHIQREVQMPGKRDSPFFLYVAYTAPHWPLHAKPEDIAKYKGRFASGWDILRKEKIERMKALGLIDEKWDIETDKRDSPKWIDTENAAWELNRMEVYAAQVDSMDQGIGRILTALETIDQLDNTFIVFFSDNGACSETWPAENPWAARFGPKLTRDGTVIDYSNDGRQMAGPPHTYFSYGPNWARYSNTPFLGYKSGTYEGGISTPCIVHWPQGLKAKGELRRQLAGIIDIMPTFAALGRVDYPKTFKGHTIIPMQGMNLLPAIIDNMLLARSFYCIEHIGRRGIIDSDQWKAVKFGKHPWQLYNLSEDRAETSDLASERPDLTEKLAQTWTEWAKASFVLTPEELQEVRDKLKK